MTKVTTATIQGQTLVLAPPTLVQRAMQLVWAGIGSLGASGFVYGLYFMLADAVYSFRWLGFSTKLTLSNVWNNWPTLVNLPTTLAFIHVGGEGGLGTWFVSQWPDIQRVFLQGWPLSVLAGAFVALAFNKGATKKINGFDRFTLKLHDVFGFIPSRLQPEPTTGPQYIFVLPLALLFAAPGAAVFFTLDLGGVALLHHFGVLHPLATLLSAAIVQIVGGGFFSHQFFANRITMKPAEDFMEFFEDRALGKAQAAMNAISDYATGVQTRASGVAAKPGLLATTIAATSAGRRVAVPWYAPPSYARTLAARQKELDKGTCVFRERSGTANILMFIAAGVMVILAIIGLYTKFILVNHGGVFL